MRLCKAADHVDFILQLGTRELLTSRGWVFGGVNVKNDAELRNDETFFFLL